MEPYGLKPSAQWGLKVLPALQVPLVRLESMELQDRQAHKARQDRKVWLVQQVRMEQPVPKVFKDRLDPLVQLELQVALALPAHKARKGSLALPAQPVFQVSLVHRALLVLPGPMA